MRKTKTRALILAVALCAGCARLTGLPDADAQLRVFSGAISVDAAGRLVAPVGGAAAGHGCIVSQLGTVTAHVSYHDETCTVEHKGASPP